MSKPQSTAIESDVFESTIRSIEQEVMRLTREIITSLEDELITQYALASDQDMVKKRFMSLGSDVGKMLEVLPAQIRVRLEPFPFWVNRNGHVERLGEWSNTTREAMVYFISRSKVADALRLEIAAIIGLFGDIFFAHAFTAMPSIQAADLPVRSGLIFVMYNKECCYGREIELPESLLSLLTTYCLHGSLLADRIRGVNEEQRLSNAEELRRARDRARLGK